MKRFEEKLDDYYAKRYLEYLERSVFALWNLDFKIDFRGIIVKIFIKNKKYTEQHYEPLLTFKKSKALYLICNFKETSEEIEEIIKEYSKENK